MLCAVSAACSALVGLDGLHNPDGGVDSSAEDSAIADGGSEAATDGDSAGAACGPDDAGLIAYFPFDEKSGLVAHDCVGALLGNVQTSSTNATWTAGHLGGGLQLHSALSECVDFGTPATLSFGGPNSAFTVTMWANMTSIPTSGAGHGVFVSRTHAGTVAGWEAVVESTSQIHDIIHNGFQDAGQIAAIAPAPSTGAFHHYAFLFNANVTLAVYIDGVLKGSVAQPPNGFIKDDSYPLRAGSSSDGQFYFDGIIDDLRFYGVALTANQIAILAAQ
jgi:hypothetical protein